MRTNRREFLGAASSVGLVLGLKGLTGAPSFESSAAASPVAPDPNDPNDPNAIVDPDHEIGKPYVGWKEGELDLNFIHTGVGENAFYIFPDGTTMLLDAGDRDAANYKDGVAILPNESKRPGEWIARYISRVKPDLEQIDYVMASHFHSDHVGDHRCGVGMKGLEGDKDYQISGISHVGEFYRFGTAFDRGYPDYSRPTTWAPSERENLVKFWDYAESNLGLKREKFEVGALDQIKLVNAPEKYDFHIRNVCANGVLWDGEEKGNIDFFEKYPKNKDTNKDENSRSIGCVLQYGGFRFWTGGDLAGTIRDNDGQDLGYDALVGRAAGPVDVCKANHHSYKDSMTSGFVNAVSPRVFVVCVWDRWHLQDNTASNMCDDSATGYPGPRIMCPTAVHPGNAEMMQGKSWRNRLVERGGHVVVKVYDGGAKYKVYYLTATDESMNVELVFGPFDATGTKRAGA
ncbi:MAG: MBL fold metallo-hydrolase [Thermoguttaceae bacterium]|jgi:beta-lactamase superfamily II metal-dependent hydrolase